MLHSSILMGGGGGVENCRWELREEVGGKARPKTRYEVLFYIHIFFQIGIVLRNSCSCSCSCLFLFLVLGSYRLFYFFVSEKRYSRTKAWKSCYQKSPNIVPVYCLYKSSWNGEKKKETAVHTMYSLYCFLHKFFHRLNREKNLFVK